MRLTIDHRTTYRFSAPQQRLVQLLRLTPEDTHDQTIASWRIDVDCDARLRTARDGFGNLVTMVYAEGPLESIEIAVTGEVLTSDTPGVLKGALDPLPPRVFCRPTPTTAPDAAIVDFAQSVARGGDAITRLHALNAALNARHRVLNQRGDVQHAVTDAFRTKEASPRDMAQLMVACVRALDLPARFVSGYCLSGFGGASRPTPHSWAEAHVEGLGWVSFDPCFGLSADENYVRVAIGLDAAGAAPVAGSRLGAGKEQLDTEISVGTVEE